MRLRQFVVLICSFVVLSALASLLSQPSYATCKCIASDGASMSRTRGVWQSVEDGGALCDTAGRYREGAPCDPLTESYIDVWFCVPTVQDLIGNLIRIIFFIAGLVALGLLLLGGFEWVASGGDDKKIATARAKILHAVVGLVVMVAVMTLVVLIEQIVFGGKVCLGISCPLDLGKYAIIENKSPGGRASCFGPASGSAVVRPTTTSTASARLTIPVAPASRSGSLVPTSRSPVIVTATPRTGQSLRRTSPIPPSKPGVTVIVLPYGSGASTPTPGGTLPGTGGGGGGYPTPTTPTL